MVSCSGRYPSEAGAVVLGAGVRGGSWVTVRQRRNGSHRVIGTLSGRWLKSSMTLFRSFLWSRLPVASAAAPQNARQRELFRGPALRVRASRYLKPTLMDYGEWSHLDK